jgi:pimeloyl-ACP methyl ester carboxylesterase
MGCADGDIRNLAAWRSGRRHCSGRHNGAQQPGGDVVDATGHGDRARQSAVGQNEVDVDLDGRGWVDDRFGFQRGLVLDAHELGETVTKLGLGEEMCAALVVVHDDDLELRAAGYDLALQVADVGEVVEHTRGDTATDVSHDGCVNALTEEEWDALYEKWAIPSPARPLFQAAVANFTLHSQAKIDTGNEKRGPLLLISGLEDHTVPDVSAHASFKLYRHSTAVTEFKQFQGRGHSLTIDHGWQEVAETALHWLAQQAL